MIKAKITVPKFKPKTIDPNKVKFVRVGVLQNVKRGDTTLVDIAITNEYGSKNIPARPFLSNASNRIKNDILQKLRKAYDGKYSYDVIAIQCKTQVQKEILNGNFKANSVSTIRKKKSDKPLVDTALLLKSITSDVVDK